ncbi:targeting protein for Xklp2 homolog [Cloeon dipterum]|uniref:targeting protein for Xklp2 homolog n=1 Tax=Cloeon dipterum TaxID=197152 RepID=UPI00322040AD
MEVEQFNYDAPQFFDFQNDVIPESIDNYFDVDHEVLKSKRAASVPSKTPVKIRMSEVASPEQENKENCTPPSHRERSSSVPPSAKQSASRPALGDITLWSAKKSQVTYLDNGRSVIVQKYDGIQIMTPNKTHQMETRLDVVIKSPGLSLRSRSITKPIGNNGVSASSKEKTESAEPSAVEQEMNVDEENESAPEERAENEVPKQAAVIPRGRSVVLLPPKVSFNPSVAPEAAKVQQPKPVRIRHNAPVVAQHSFIPKPAAKPEEKGSRFQATAELVRKFHRATPDRFHSVPLNKKPQPKKPHSPLVAKPNTIPKSPFLTSKTRVRNEHIPSHADKEEAELEEIKKNQIKAKPVPRQVLLPPVQRDLAVAKIPATKPSPFKLSEGKRKMPTPEPVFRFKANPVPRRMLQSPQGIPEKKNLPLTEPHTPALALNAKYPKKPKLDGIDLKKIGHSGVPIVKQMTPHKLTQVQPFSFEERSKEILQKRQELLHKQIEEEKQAREFKAGKKPTFRQIPTLPEKKTLPPTVPHTPKLSTYTFGAKQQQKFYEKLAEEQQKLQEAAQFKAKPAIVTQIDPFHPLLPHRIITDVAPVAALTLNTEKRAVERAKFDEIIRAHDRDKEEHRRLLELMKEEEARKEEMKMRKEAEFHAHPVRKGTPMKIKPSERPLTEPRSPNFKVDERLSKH